MRQGTTVPPVLRYIYVIDIYRTAYRTAPVPDRTAHPIFQYACGTGGGTVKRYGIKLLNILTWYGKYGCPRPRLFS